MSSLYTVLWIIAGILQTATTATRHGTRYTLYTHGKTQTDALLFCEERGEHLVSFQSEEKFNRFLEIITPWISKNLLNDSFWVSLKKNSSSFVWHDRTVYEDDYSNLTMIVNQSEKQCFIVSKHGNKYDLKEEDCFNKTYQVICEKDLGLCPFEVFPDTKYTPNGQLLKTDVGKLDLETCERRCLDHYASSDDCVGVKRDGDGTCHMLTGFVAVGEAVPTSPESGSTLSLKKCYEEHFGGNPSQATVFTLYNFKLSWDQTRAFCEYTKQRMLKLDSPTKISAFNDMHKEWIDKELVFTRIWTGLRYTNASGSGAYTWTDEQPLSSINQWSNGEPQRSVTKQCISLRTGNRKWTSNDCMKRYQVACEQPTAECGFKETTMVPVEAPSHTTTGGTELDCQTGCQTQAWDGFECSLYIYDDTTSICRLYSGILTLEASTSTAMKKECFFGHFSSHINLANRYSFYDLSFTKLDSDTFCKLVGEEPLNLTDSSRYMTFVQILQQQNDIPIHGEIWAELGTPVTTTCNVITTGATIISTTKDCNGQAQSVCFTDKFDCVFRIYKDSTISGENFLHLPGLSRFVCRDICSRIEAGGKICVGFEHDLDTDCRLVMRRELMNGSLAGVVNRPGNQLNVVECNFGSFANQETKAKIFSVHGIRLTRDAGNDFCTQIGKQPLMPYSITELHSIFDVLHYWQDLNFFADLDHVWTNVDLSQLGHVVSDLKSSDDPQGDSCIALNHMKAAWSSYSCERDCYIVCESIDGNCTMDEFPLKSLVDRNNALMVSAVNAAACQAWCMTLGASFKECVAAEFDAPSCKVFFSDSVYITHLPEMTASSTATVFIRRCFSVITPNKVELTGYKFAMFDTPMTHDQAKDACRSEGLEMIKLDNVSSSALSDVYDRSKTSWLGLTPLTSPLRGTTWTDGSQVSWTNWGEQVVPVPGQCVVLNSSDLSWTTDNCGSNNFALCGNGKGACWYDSYLGQKLPNTVVQLSNMPETKCISSCNDVLFNNTVCRGVTTDGDLCLLDMGEDIYSSDPVLVNDGSYNTYLRFCHKVEEVSYTPQGTTMSPSSLLEETSLNVEPSSRTEQQTYSMELSTSFDESTLSQNIFSTIAETDELAFSTETFTDIYLDISSSHTEAGSVQGTTTVASDSVMIQNGIDFPSNQSMLSTTIQMTPTPQMNSNDGFVSFISTGTYRGYMSTIALGDPGTSSVVDIPSGSVGSTTDSLGWGNSSDNFWINENGRIVRSVCLCRCKVPLPETPSLMSEKVKGLRKDLIVTKKNVSSYRRAKTTAQNKKPAVVAMGSALGISILSVTFVTLLFLDISNICRMISRKLHSQSRVSQL
ncbi:uncharacterized protein [Haliotis asinina]|uniref:uncharacterized protein n=1 Tax=Haliotis asinina TaxID=109174 RepID=UPI003531A4CA